MQNKRKYIPIKIQCSDRSLYLRSITNKCTFLPSWCYSRHCINKSKGDWLKRFLPAIPKGMKNPELTGLFLSICLFIYLSILSKKDTTYLYLGNNCERTPQERKISHGVRSLSAIFYLRECMCDYFSRGSTHRACRPYNTWAYWVNYVVKKNTVFWPWLRPNRREDVLFVGYMYSVPTVLKLFPFIT